MHPDTVSLGDILDFLKAFKSYSAKNHPEFSFVHSSSEFEDAITKRKLAIFFSLEGTHLLKGNISLVDSLYEVGIRMVGIGHRFHNDFLVEPNFPTGKREPRFLNDNSILSPSGRLLVKKLLEKGIIVDISHLGRAAFDEIILLNAGRSPIVASHSNARAICDTTRNLSDDQLKEIAKTNGLVGISLHSPLLTKSPNLANISIVVDHIEHMIEVMGADHVAIGTDFEGRIKPPFDLQSIDRIPNLLREMRKRNFADSVISKVVWRNAARIILNQLQIK